MRALKIATLISNMCIIIGAGHGIFPMILMEVFLVGLFQNSSHLTFSLTASYDNSLLAAAIFSLLGQIFMFSDIVTKKLSLSFVGLFFMCLGLYYLTHNMFDDAFGSVARFSFGSAVPFLILSVVLLVLSIKDARSYRDATKS